MTGTLTKTFATLRLYGTALQPEVVTASLGASPTTTRLPDPDAGSRRPAFWFLSSDGKVSSEDPALHVRWVLDALGEGADPARAPGVEMAAMDVYWYSSNCRSLRLPNSVVDRVAGLGLELWVDPSSEPCERHGDSK